MGTDADGDGTVMAPFFLRPRLVAPLSTDSRVLPVFLMSSGGKGLALGDGSDVDDSVKGTFLLRPRLVGPFSADSSILLPLLLVTWFLVSLSLSSKANPNPARFNS